MSSKNPTTHSSELGGMDLSVSFNPNHNLQYTSLPTFPLASGTGASASLPNTRDLWNLANVAWRGSQYKIYDKKRGLLFKGRDFLQWLLYHLAISDTTEHVLYAQRIAQAFMIKRYLLQNIKPSMFHRRRSSRSIQFKSNHRELYEFNEVAVSKLHVVILVQRGSNLLARDRNGTSDPVCRLSLGGEQIRQTTVIKKSCYPEWNEVFTFGVRDVGAQQLTFEIYDYDPGKGNDFLGYVRLPLHRILFEDRLKKMKAKKLRLLRQQSLLNYQSNKSLNAKGNTTQHKKYHQTNFRAHEVAANFTFSGMNHNADMLMVSTKSDVSETM